MNPSSGGGGEGHRRLKELIKTPLPKAWPSPSRQLPCGFNENSRAHTNNLWGAANSFSRERAELPTLGEDSEWKEGGGRQ